MSRSFPNSLLNSTSTPISNILFVVALTMFFSNLNSGIPCESNPPNSSCFSYIVTFIPFLARKAAQVKPAGPPPTIATFLLNKSLSIIFGIL